MKLAINQPYLFPYIGYFQLIAAVDKFVFLDDVNFIKSGWIHRNRILIAGETRYITVPLSQASQTRKINDIAVHEETPLRRKLMGTLRQSYARAPHFSNVVGLVQEVLAANDSQISVLAERSVVAVCRYLGLNTEFVMSSAQYRNLELKGEERVLDICKKEVATDYFNLPGGRQLYDERRFREKGISLHFIKPNLQPYPQFAQEFHAGLSILDILMFNDRQTARKMLEAQRPLLPDASEKIQSMV